MPSVSTERAGRGAKRPIELRKNLIMSSCVSQQNSRPLWMVGLVIESFWCCFLLELELYLGFIGTTRFLAPWRMRSIASNKLKDKEKEKEKAGDY